MEKVGGVSSESAMAIGLNDRAPFLGGRGLEGFSCCRRSAAAAREIHCTQLYEMCTECASRFYSLLVFLSQ